ncbi:MAG: o-succinylbenzoate synthase [Bacteroidota bacterium]
MRLKFDFVPRELIFRFDAGTSRGVLKTRKIWWVSTTDLDLTKIGWGEAAPLVKLSIDDRPDFEARLKEILAEAENHYWELGEDALLTQVESIVPFEFPTIRFALEMALLDFFHGGRKRFFENGFRDDFQSIPINGLIWMGDRDFMLAQIEEKIASGFDCIKMKIGALDFDLELTLLRFIRDQYSSAEIMLRVDANGAFSPKEALEKMQKLADLDIHSIEQPIPAGQFEQMRLLCQNSALPIALDEELIGIKNKAELLDRLLPQHIILKPSLLGGFKETDEWIQLAEERAIGWWMTSALESNIGLNAIAQLASKYQPSIHQGLGTGKLFHNNLSSPLHIEMGKIRYLPTEYWDNPQ